MSQFIVCSLMFIILVVLDSAVVCEKFVDCGRFLKCIVFGVICVQRKWRVFELFQLS